MQPPLSNMENIKTGMIELFPGMRGFYAGGPSIKKKNDKAQVLRHLFIQVDDNDQEIGSYYFDPNGAFTNMVAPENLDRFISDDDSWNPNNPSGFNPDTYEVLQRFKDNPSMLKDYIKKNPNFSIWKQGTTK